jgi:hypothetical protein
MDGLGWKLFHFLKTSLQLPAVQSYWKLELLVKYLT